MKKAELVYRELLYSKVEQGKAVFTQLELAKALGISLSTVNNALRPLRKMGAVNVKRRGFDLVNAKKILYYWASIRNLGKDVIYRTRVESSVLGIEKEMPSFVVFAAYSAYKFRFDDAPADYSEVYAYCDSSSLDVLARRFPPKKNNPNLFVLKKEFMDSRMPLAQMFVDLWNIKEWYASDFVKALEERLNGILA